MVFATQSVLAHAPPMTPQALALMLADPKVSRPNTRHRFHACELSALQHGRFLSRSRKHPAVGLTVDPAATWILSAYTCPSLLFIQNLTKLFKKRFGMPVILLTGTSPDGNLLCLH